MWEVTKHGLYHQFNFKDFHDAWEFMQQVANLAEAEQHHPRWENEWNVVQIWLTTHGDKNTITDKDRFLASAIDAIYAKASLPDRPAAVSRVEEVKVFADGGSRGNPGPSASGYVILNMEDQELETKGIYLGITTNNQAEYMALKYALESCRERQVKDVHVYMDSMLVISQMQGLFKIKNRDLWPIHDAIKNIATSFRHVAYQHVPREFNKAADAAVNRTLDEALHISKP